jgi:hypothetical protein
MVRFRGTPVRKCRFEFERAIDVSGEREPQGVNLCLYFRHRPSRRTFLKDTHVSREVVPRIRMKMRIRGCNSNLGRVNAVPDSTITLHVPDAA